MTARHVDEEAMLVFLSMAQPLLQIVLGLTACATSPASALRLGEWVSHYPDPSVAETFRAEGRVLVHAVFASKGAEPWYRSGDPRRDVWRAVRRVQALRGDHRPGDALDTQAMVLAATVIRGLADGTPSGQ